MWMIEKFKEHIVQRIYSLFLTCFFLVGCSSTPQNNDNVDLASPIPEGKARIQLYRTSSIVGAIRSVDIYDNDQLIGDIDNNSNLIWDRDADKIMCLSDMQWDRKFDKYIVNPLITVMMEPDHPNCFIVEAGKLNNIFFIYVGAKFLGEEEWLESQ